MRNEIAFALVFISMALSCLLFIAALVSVLMMVRGKIKLASPPKFMWRWLALAWCLLLVGIFIKPAHAQFETIPYSPTSILMPKSFREWPQIHAVTVHDSERKEIMRIECDAKLEIEGEQVTLTEKQRAALRRIYFCKRD